MCDFYVNLTEMKGCFPFTVSWNQRNFKWVEVSESNLENCKASFVIWNVFFGINKLSILSVHFDMMRIVLICGCDWINASSEIE